MISEHYEDILRFYGKDLGARVARKHLGWYLDAIAEVPPDLRRAVLTAPTPGATQAALRAALDAAGQATELAA